MSDEYRARIGLFALALAVQVAIVGGLAAINVTSASSSQAVYLELQPVDPRDPLRGDYVTIAYEVGEFDSSMLGEPWATSEELPSVGSTVYVPLTRAGTTWEVAWGVTNRLPDLENDTEARDSYGRGTVLMRGVVKSAYGNAVTVTYGIEEYFIPEGTGATWPTDPNVEATARVLIDPQGRAQLDQLFVEGKPWP